MTVLLMAESGKKHADKAGSLFLWLFCLCMLSFSASAETSIKFGVYPNEPFMYRDKAGNPAGLVIDSLQYVAAKKGWKIHYVYGSWSEIIRRLQDGEIDLTALSHSQQNELLVDLSFEPILVSWTQVYVHSSSSIQTIVDLKGKNIAIAKSKRKKEEFLKLVGNLAPPPKVVDIEENEEILEMVSERKVDAGVLDSFWGLKLQNRYDVKISPILFLPVSVVFAVPDNKNRFLLDSLDAYLSVLKDDHNSFYYQSLEKWFGSQPRFILPKWLIWLLAAFGAFLVLFLVHNLILRIRVRKATADLRHHKDNLEQIVEERTYELQEEKNKYFETVNRLNDGVLLYSGETVLVKNPAFDAILSDHEKDFFTILRKRIASNQANGQSESALPAPKTARFELRLPQENTYHKYLDVNYSPTVLNGVSSYIVTVRDVSLQRIAEMEKDQTLEMLKKAKENAEEANRAKSEFLANISHELRTPMQAILGFSRLGLERLDQISRDKIQEYFNTVYASGKRLLILVNDLLDLSKLESGRFDYDFREEHLSKIVELTIRTLHPLLREQRLSIEFLNSDINDLVLADRERIEQVVSNLLSNAIKFSPPGDQITVELKELDSEIQVSVIDRGVGIPENELESVFDAFIQSSKTKTGAGGTGLGLAISKRIIVAHEGRIWATLNPEGGSTLHFTVPKKAAA